MLPHIFRMLLRKSLKVAEPVKCAKKPQNFIYEVGQKHNTPAEKYGFSKMGMTTMTTMMRIWFREYIFGSLGMCVCAEIRWCILGE